MKLEQFSNDKNTNKKIRISGLRVLIVGAFFIGVMILLAGCFPEDEAVLAPPLIEPSIREYQTQEVGKGDIINKISVIGNVISAAEYALSYERGGVLDTVFVRNGTEVEAGQILVQLDKGDLEVQIELAQLNLRKLELTLEEARANLRDARQSQNALRLFAARTINVQRLEIDLANQHEINL
jgi:multidrug efflux pump subunit AcrA (membrane-fusion protein)